MVLYIWEKFNENISNLQSGHKYMVETAMLNVQKAITQKKVNQSYSSWVLHVVIWSFFVWSFTKLSETVSNLQSGH